MKEKVRVVYTSHFKTPEECKGAIRIATNRPIPITIEGATDVTTKKDLGGYYAVKAQDLKGFIDAVKANKER